MMHGDLIISRHISQHYRTLFNRKTGAFIRKEDVGYQEPFWSIDGPELLDISITNYCERECAFCYRQSNRHGTHMSMDDIYYIVKQAKKVGVLQIALGGGNPNQHPHFCDILKLIKSNGMVPSYTTNGEGLTDEILTTTAMNCGAMAISAYPPFDNRYDKLLRLISKYGIRCNLHMILKEDIIDMAIDWLQTPPNWFKYVNALIFLNYKPINKHYLNNPIDQEKLRIFFHAVSNCKAVKIGFDSCCISGLVENMNVPSFLIESCEAARFSAFISEDLKMYPCSFMVDTNQYGDLRNRSLLDIWQADEIFINHRNKLQYNGCSKCIHHDVCMGGCPFVPQINLCSKNNKFI